MKTKAVRLYGKEDLRLEEFELPAIGPDEILAKIISDSICMSSYKAAIQGTDHKRVPGDIADNPVIIGHEFCGDVVEVGSAVRSLKIGDFISADSHIFDGTCHVCRNGQPHICQNLVIFGVDTNGSYAEYVTVPETSAWKNDPDLDPAIGWQGGIPGGDAVIQTDQRDPGPGQRLGDGLCR